MGKHAAFGWAHIRCSVLIIVPPSLKLGGRFGYFLFFSARAREGEGRVRGAGGRGGFIENPKGGGVSRTGGAEAGRVSAANWRIWGGGGKYFFRGRKCPSLKSCNYPHERSFASESGLTM